jgi:hypothetical protein
MKITIENTNGQKYLMTGEEFVDQFASSLVNETFDGNPATFFEGFLSSYEEGTPDPNCNRCKWCWVDNGEGRGFCQFFSTCKCHNQADV